MWFSELLCSEVVAYRHLQGLNRVLNYLKKYGLIVLFLLQHSLVQVNRKGLHEEQSSGLGTGEEYRSKIKLKGHLFGP